MMDRRIRVAAVAASPLLHEGLVRVLRDDSTLLVSTEMVRAETLTSCWNASPTDVVLIHITAPLPPSSWRDISMLTLQTKVLVLSRCQDSDTVKRAHQLGVAGIVSEDADRDVIFKAIHELAAGGVWSDSPAPTCPCDPARTAPSKREHEVLCLVRRGLSNREIADQLCISERTVKSHVNRLLQKFQVNNRVQLALCSDDVAHEVPQG